MGFSAGWFAVSGVGEGEIVDRLPFELGESLPGLRGPAIGTIDGWTIVYSDGEPLLADRELKKLATEGRTVVVHQSVDSVMYARTAVWEDGKPSWSAIVDNDQLKTSDLAKRAEQKLKKELQSSASNAYDEIAELARRTVGFRHDQTKGLTQFTALIDTTREPVSMRDRLVDWLLDEGFELVDGGSIHEHFRRPVDQDFAIVVDARPSRRPDPDWCQAWVRIAHGPTNDVLRVARGVRTSTVSHTNHDGLKPAGLKDPAVDPYTFTINFYRSEIEGAIEHCSINGISQLAGPGESLAIEVARGWSTRGESLRRQCELIWAHRKQRHPMLDWLDENAGEADVVAPELSDQDPDELRRSLDAGEVLTFPELAALQTARCPGSPSVEALAFGHWILALNDEELDPAIATHLIDRHRHDKNLAERHPSYLTWIHDIPLNGTIQSWLSADSDVQLKSRFATNPALSETLQHQFAELGIARLAKNPNLSAEAQGLLLDRIKTEPRSLELLAASPVLTEDVQWAMVALKDRQVASDLAHNTFVSEDVLVKLARHRAGDVKGTAAANPGLPDNVQLELLEKGNGDSVAGLSRNPRLSLAVQQVFVDRGELRKISGNPALDRRFMDELLTSTNAVDRQALAANTNLPLDIQQTLIQDSDETVRTSVAANQTTDEALHQTLTEDPSPKVQRAARRRYRRGSWD